jgi:hypothetical protein
MNHIFEKTNEFIFAGLKEKKSVLVFCDYGTNISSSIIAGFLIKYLKLDFLTSIMYVNSIRKCGLAESSCIINALYNYYLYIYKQSF